MKIRSLLRAGFAILVLANAAQALPDFTTFESGQVRPLALSPDGSLLLVVNTPDDQLEIFATTTGDPVYLASVPVGMEPVAVAFRSTSEAWVVNHLSDSISIIDLSSSPPRVVRTLLVGDEPRDIVFAGSGGGRAFVTTAHRGQQRTDPSLSGVSGAGDPQLTTAGVGRADVWVFDAGNLGTTLGGTPLAIVTLFGDTPRALAVSPDGNTVYAAIFNSGNRTTTVSEGVVCDGGALAGPCSVAGVTMPGGLPPPNTNFEGHAQPEVGLIVRYDATAGRWQDELGRNWNSAVKFALPDLDVFAIDANATPPAATASFPSVGTTIFNMAVNPASGNVYVSNTEARNEVRFEGPGDFANSTVRGHLHEARVTVLDIAAGGTVEPHHLNKHIDYGLVPSPTGTAEDSLATPLGMVISADGAKLYVAAFGSSKIGVYDVPALESDSFDPRAVPHIVLSGGGPTGLALHPTAHRLYALTRFDNSLAVINTDSQLQVASLPLHNPEPFRVLAGRPMLYDAHFTSSNGEASCSSCHIFGDMDHLGWDLGNPDGIVEPIFNPFRVQQLPGGVVAYSGFHPMKGPMTTQSLRGMAHAGPMHWRGDRTGSATGQDALDEDLAFKAFNVAFEGLLGRAAPLTDADMQAFTDFVLQITYPPNPVRALSNELTPDQAAGRDFYMNSFPSDIVQNCNGCHRLDPALHQFGTDGFMSFENETQFMKIPHLRNAYQKLGMFGMPAIDFFNPGNNGNKGDQVRGFGFLHDGSTDTVFRFLNATAFNQVQFGISINPGGFRNGSAGDPLRRQVESFILAFDSDLPPILGQQVTLTASNATAVGARIALLRDRFVAGECDLIVKGVIAGEARGAYLLGDLTYQLDRAGDAPLTHSELTALAATPGQELTFTAVPVGAGRRLGVDRDGDTLFDGDERDAGSNPADATSLPANTVRCESSTSIAAVKLVIRGLATAAADDRLVLKAEVQLPSIDPPIDPVAYGISLRIDDRNGEPALTWVVPNGVPTTKGAPGWRANSRRTSWTYTDRSGGAAAGIIKVKVKDYSRTKPGLFKIAVTGKKGDFALSDADLPIRITTVLGGGLQVANHECASLAFGGAGDPSPSCLWMSGGDRLSCR